MIGNLPFDQRRLHIAWADSVDADAELRAFESRRLGEAEQAVLGGDIGALERRGDKGVGARYVDDAAPLAHLHLSEGKARGVKGGRQVEVDDDPAESKKDDQDDQTEVYLLLFPCSENLS